MNDFTPGNFSVSLMQWGREFPTAPGVVEVARRAETRGYHSIGLSWMTTLPDSFWEGEGLVRGWQPTTGDRPGHYLDSLALLPMIAQATSELQFGLNAFIAPALHPFYVAKYLATLDVASGGRLATMFGFGVTEDDGTSRMFEWLGSTVPAGRRGDAAEEALEVITKLWTESAPLDHAGEFFFGKQMLVEPKPVQKPYPEIWWAGERKRSLKLAARFARYLELHGDGLSRGGGHPLTRIREFYVPELQAANDKWGGSAQIAVEIGVRVTEKPLTTAERAELYWFDDRPDSPFHEVLPVGSPEQCAEAILALRDAGVAHFSLDISQHGYESLTFAIEQLDAWASDVVPLL